MLRPFLRFNLIYLFGVNKILIGNILLVFGTFVCVCWEGGDQISTVNLGQKGRRRVRQAQPTGHREAYQKAEKNGGQRQQRAQSG